jgi:hypothetical protein
MFARPLGMSLASLAALQCINFFTHKEVLRVW